MSHGAISSLENMDVSEEVLGTGSLRNILDTEGQGNT